MRLYLVLDSIFGEHRVPLLKEGKFFIIFSYITHEILRTLKHKHGRKQGSMVLKLDMSKAFDRVELFYIRELMLQVGFPNVFVDLIINCISIITYSNSAYKWWEVWPYYTWERLASRWSIVALLISSLLWGYGEVYWSARLGRKQFMGFRHLWEVFIYLTCSFRMTRFCFVAPRLDSVKIYVKF